MDVNVSEFSGRMYLSFPYPRLSHCSHLTLGTAPHSSCATCPQSAAVKAQAKHSQTPHGKVRVLLLTSFLTLSNFPNSSVVQFPFTMGKRRVPGLTARIKRAILY